MQASDRRRSKHINYQLRTKSYVDDELAYGIAAFDGGLEFDLDGLACRILKELPEPADGTVAPRV